MDQGRASHIRPPLRIGTDTTRVRLYSATTLSQVHALPATWAGQYIRIRCEGGTVDFYLTSTSTAAIDRTVAATSTGAASTSLGDRLGADEDTWCVVPDSPGQTQYLVRQADVSTAALRISLRTGA